MNDLISDSQPLTYGCSVTKFKIASSATVGGAFLFVSESERSQIQSFLSDATVVELSNEVKEVAKLRLPLKGKP